jgi:hypothetical protein
MGPARFGPILVLAIALAACAAPPSQPTGIQPTGTQATGTQTGSLQSGRDPSIPSQTVLAPSGGLSRAQSTGTGAELAAVTDILTDLQYASFAVNAEHCGYIGLDRSGEIMVSPINRGTEDSCTMPQPPSGMTLLASFHTHGTYSPYYASEFPTTNDMLTDAAENIDGYISTPGGRLWYVDTDTMTVRLLCDRGCLPQDPAYRPDADGPLRPVMTYDYLRRWENS